MSWLALWKIRCDSCGATSEVTADPHEEPPGWVIAKDEVAPGMSNHYCHRCWPHRKDTP